MRTTFAIVATIWAGLFTAFVSGHYEPSGYEVGVMLLYMAVSSVMLAFTINADETTSTTYEIALGTAEVDGETVHVAEISKPDGVTVTFYGESAEDVRRKAIEYIEKGGE